MVSINPIDVMLWTFRRSEKDTIKLYDSLSPVMQTATGGNMLNFGYWNDEYCSPLLAQENMCNEFGKLSNLEENLMVLDVGSGLSAPSIFWKNQFRESHFIDININLKQLQLGKSNKFESVNATSTLLPIKSNSVDRVLALESAQHFKPLDSFLSESKRILKKDGILTMAIPVTVGNPSLKDLGLIKFTWSSEQYSIYSVTQKLKSSGFSIISNLHIGDNVYSPLTEYYSKNRENLKKSIQSKYSSYVESILYKSLLKMKEASEKKYIEYLFLKCVIEN